ncbi:MAG: tRNA (adenosine(37)-N6)-dimethylallyltransferase MiaA, partial [Clostridiales bacterium]|nr:tRNA (adenosine(37)-N6)-dimethylallyltransferase MiaA [Clostridiales bacterium]
ERKKDSAYSSCYFVLNDDREKLYERIDARVDQMLSDGLIAEVKKLLAMGCKRSDTAMQGLGYKEILDYLNGEITLERAIYLIKRDTRHFAKRQLTWFRREKEVIWINKPDFDYFSQRIIDYMVDCFEKRKGKEIEKD